MEPKIEKRTVKASVLVGDTNDFVLVGLAASYNTLSADVGGFTNAKCALYIYNHETAEATTLLPLKLT
jgi:hypothetical protein